ncbi:MAG: ribosome maturation factor RimP [Deltaproteobacteria bacterium]|nr:ribosome maturation factor RimP [Deltaproteobacteria bacterium]
MATSGDTSTAPQFRKELEERLWSLVEPVVKAEGLVLVELALGGGGGRGRLMRLVVDRPDGGVTVDECAVISRQIGDLLDVEDVIEGSYSLEVGSPGLNRRLKSPREYELFAGRPAKLVVREPDGTTRTLLGTLKGLAGPDVLLEQGGRVSAVPLAQVAKARLEADIRE